MNRLHLGILLIALTGVLLCVLLSGLYFQFSYFEPDTVSYLFQAKLFARGKLCLPAPPEYGFSSSPHVNILNGKWYSKYPFGNALMLTFGEWLHAPWLIPALATGATLLLLYALVREVYGPRVALVASLLGLISPATLGMGSTWFSEPVSRFYLALFLLGLFRTLRGGGKRYALLAGFALGYAFNTRPMPAVAFGVAGAGLALITLAARPNRRLLMRRLLLFLIPFAFMLGLCAAWNAYFTGDPLQFTHNAAQPYDRLGFGKRSEGYDPDLERAFLFTPRWALERLWRHTIPCVSYNTLGWGEYTPNLFREPGRLRRGGPLILPLLLMLLPLFHRSRSRYDGFFLSLFLLQLALYFPFYFEGSTWGFTPVNARYYNECTLLGILPLIARGMVLLGTWLNASRFRRVLLPVAVGALFLLSLNTVSTYRRLAGPYRNWGDVYQKLPRLVKAQGLRHAVVFIPRHRGAPLGDYPFEPLDRANIVYFKLGPSKMWRLTNSDWRTVYARYFVGRRAYWYESGRLTALEPVGIIPDK